MPPINRYECNKCDFKFPEGWGIYMYAIDDKGKRRTCSHPHEMGDAERIIGKELTKDVIAERTGFNSDCVCLDCVRQFRLDLGDEGVNPRDKRECRVCHSENVKTLLEMVGQLCPKCKTGEIKEIETGWVS